MRKEFLSRSFCLYCIITPFILCGTLKYGSLTDRWLHCPLNFCEIIVDEIYPIFMECFSDGGCCVGTVLCRAVYVMMWYGKVAR